MNFNLLPLSQEDLTDYKKEMQEAFQKGDAAEFADLDTETLPEEDIDRSLNAVGSIAYKAIVDDKMVGGDYFFRFEKISSLVKGDFIYNNRRASV